MGFDAVYISRYVQRVWKKLVPPYSGYKIKQIVPCEVFLSAKLDSVITRKSVFIVAPCIS